MEHKLLIAPIFKSLSKLRKLRYKKVIQNRPFEYGVKIKNMGDTLFKGGFIKNIEITPLNTDIDFCLFCDKKFEIPPLNKEDVCFIWFERLSSTCSGQFYFEFKIINKEKEEIISYQWDKDNNEPFLCEKKGIWGDFFDIKDEHALQQEITNYAIIFLTFLIILGSIL